MMTIDNTGNVGIGTTTPTAKLVVVANTPSEAVRFSNTGGGRALNVGSAGMEVSGTAILALDGGAKVGIGTMTPQEALHVVGSIVAEAAKNGQGIWAMKGAHQYEWY